MRDALVGNADAAATFGRTLRPRPSFATLSIASETQARVTARHIRPFLRLRVLSTPPASRCSGFSATTGKVGSSEFSRFTTFVSADEVRSETMIANRNNAAESDGRFTTRMTRLGACDGSLKPGGMMLTHWRVNDEETLKARQIQNIYREISDFRALTAAQLDGAR